MEKPKLDPEELVLSLSDVKRLYISNWRWLGKWALIGGALTFLYLASLSPKYKAEASFKEGVEKSSPESFLKEVVIGLGPTNQPQAASLMKSYQVLKPLVEKMGLQITAARSGWIVKKIYKRCREVLRAEKGLPLEDIDTFAFQDVIYENEKGSSFNLKFLDPTHFTIYSDNRRAELGKGLVGEEVCVEDLSIRFTVNKTPKALKINTFYPFHVGSWIDVASGIRDQIKITRDKLNTSIYNISLTGRDRHLCTRMVNELMSQYQRYLKREYDQLAREQLAYLEGKQSQIYAKMENLFDQHTTYLTRNLEENGFSCLEQETESFLIPHQEMQTKSLAIDVELARLDQIEKEGKSVPIAEEGCFSMALNQIADKIQGLKQERDLLGLSLSSTPLTEPHFISRKEELREIRNQRCEVEKLIQEIDLEGDISSFDLNEGLCLWAKTLHNSEEREDLAEYLENYARLLSLREKMLQERFFYGKNVPEELEGIDLASARALFLEYNAKLDTVQASMSHFERLRREIHQPDFDLASLSSTLKDPLCQKIIADASLLGLQLKDEKHHSSKEAERWREEISLQKKVLADHLEQLHKVDELTASLIRDKMRGLQKLSLDCINQQISVLHEQASDSIKARRQALLLEKNLLQEKMDEIRKSFSTLFPEKWRFEKWLEIKTEMVGKMMETMTEVVESKTISTHLHHVESRPLDRAIVPLVPLSPRLYVKTFLGAFILPFLLFIFRFIRQILKGFPVSLEKLQDLHLPVLGSLSAFCDGPSVETPTGPDLELLRKLTLFSESGKVIGLLSGKGPDYSYALAENLARMSIKSIILRCDFQSKFRKEDGPGLLQLWKGESAELPIRQGKGFDYITAGGYSPYGTEIIQSQTFAQLLDLLKKNYDRIYLFSRSPLSSAESTVLLRHCDQLALTVQEERIEELTPFIDWGYSGDRCRLTFITPA